MKILFLNPVRGTTSIPIFPMGMGYLSSSLKAAGYGDITGFHSSDPLWKGGVEKSDILGIHVTTMTFIEAMQLATEARKLNSRMTIIAGGPHATLRSEEVLSHEDIDIVVRGEAEETIVELVKALEKKGPEKNISLSQVKGIYYKDDGTMIKLPPREAQNDLDRIPFPDRDLFKNSIKRFFTHVSTDMLAGRSCLYHCMNCMPALRKIMGRYRIRSVESVFDEMSYLKRRGITSIHFNDNSITHFRDWTVNLCEKLIEKKLKVQWSSAVCEWETDLELLKLMRKAGCRGIGFGVESGSQRVQDKVLRKKVNLEHAKKVAQWCDEAGISTHCWFMMAIPGETREDALETIKFATELNVNSTSFNISSPNPSTGYQIIADKKGWNRAKSYADLDNRERIPMIVTPEYDENFVRELDEKLIQEYKKQGWDFERDQHTFLFFNRRKDFRNRPFKETIKAILRYMK
jgi:anaerobic magnesium-protoporphyrin IX monomethyl ester cyclase